MSGSKGERAERCLARAHRDRGARAGSSAWGMTLGSTAWRIPGRETHGIRPRNRSTGPKHRAGARDQGARSRTRPSAGTRTGDRSAGPGHATGTRTRDRGAGSGRRPGHKAGARGCGPEHGISAGKAEARGNRITGFRSTGCPAPHRISVILRKVEVSSPGRPSRSARRCTSGPLAPSTLQTMTNDTALFLGQWIRSPGTVGAVAPSSRRLAEAVASPVPHREIR